MQGKRSQQRQRAVIPFSSTFCPSWSLRFTAATFSGAIAAEPEPQPQLEPQEPR